MVIEPTPRPPPSGRGSRTDLEDGGGGAAGGFVVLVGARDVEQAREGLVGGFGEEGLRALGGDALHLVEEGLNVGLVGPVGELHDGGVEEVGELGEAGVVVEPGLEEFFVVRGQEIGGMGFMGGMGVIGVRGRTWCWVVSLHVVLYPPWN